MSLKLLYAYPKWHKVSFTLVAEKHVEYLAKLRGVTVETIDELAVHAFVPVYKYTLVMHPAFFMMDRVLKSRIDVRGRFREDYYMWWRSLYDTLVGIDVCDSDRYSEYAVELANRFDALILPSSFCAEVAKRSGVKAKVYRVPHGVDPEWYSAPNVWDVAPVRKLNPSLLQLYLYKVRKGVKVLLFWLWHSPERKGWPEVLDAYVRLRKERKDVTLVLKTFHPHSSEYAQVMKYGAVNVYGWLNDYEKMALYDLADVTLNFARGGGFELNCLESLARGVPCVASDWGSWKDYVPPFLRTAVGKKVKPLPGNAIHAGCGYAIDVEKAVDLLHRILDDVEEYKAKVAEWKEEALAKEYRWDLVAVKLTNALESLRVE